MGLARSRVTPYHLVKNTLKDGNTDYDPNHSWYPVKTRPPMRMLPFTLAGLSAAFLFGLVWATPIIFQGPQGVKQLYPLQVSSFLPFARYSAAAYCRPSKTISWDCGGIDVINLRISARSLNHLLQQIVTRTATSNPWHPVAMETTSHFVRDYLFFFYIYHLINW